MDLTVRMAGFIEGVSRDRTTLFPERLDKWIGEDHRVRVVDLFVDQLDLPAPGFQRHAAARTGRPGADEAVHLRLSEPDPLQYHRIRKKIERLLAMDKALADAPDGQSPTGPDARAMATRAQHSGHVGDYVQSVVDAETPLPSLPDQRIVTHEVTNQGPDRNLLTKTSTQAKVALQRDDMHILACHITATVPRSDTSGARPKGHFVKADFAYDHDADVHRCPARRALAHRTTTEQQGLRMRRYWTNACKDCALKSCCTTGKTDGFRVKSTNIWSKPRMPTCWPITSSACVSGPRG